MKLKRCPFCGGKAYKDKNEHGKWFVICEGCLAEVIDVYCKGKKGAIEQWNSRYKKQ